MPSIRSMRSVRLTATLLATALLGALASAPARGDEPKASEGFQSIFNGKDLTGWEGLDGFWSAKDGMIVGQETKATSKQTFLTYTASKVKDFELHLKYKFASADGNSGIQFRSKMIDPKTYRVGGYQADFDGHGGFDGSIYDEAGVAGGRGTMSNRGEKTTWDAENKRHNEKLPEDNAALKKFIKVGDWNDVVLVVQGDHVTYSINGHLMTDLTDNSPKALKEGVLALQIHAGFTMEIQFKDVEMKVLTPQAKANDVSAPAQAHAKAIAPAAPAPVALSAKK